VRFWEGSAERMDRVQSESVDMVVAGQSAHFFKYPEAWEEIDRVLCPGGTVAFWSYPTLMLPESQPFKRSNDKLLQFILGPTDQRLGPFWEQPANEILWSHYTKLPPPPDGLFDGSTQRLTHFLGGHFPNDWVPTKIRSYPLLQAMEQTTWVAWEQWIRDSDAGNRMFEEHPERRLDRRADLIGNHFARLRRAVALVTRDNHRVWLDMPLSLYLVRKRMRLVPPVLGEPSELLRDQTQSDVEASPSQEETHTTIDAASNRTQEPVLAQQAPQDAQPQPTRGDESIFPEDAPSAVDAVQHASQKQVPEELQASAPQETETSVQRVATHLTVETVFDHTQPLPEQQRPIEAESQPAQDDTPASVEDVPVAAEEADAKLNQPRDSKLHV